MLAMLRRGGYLIVAVLLHVIILLILIFSYEFQAPFIVFENTSKQDVISAVVLGDTPDSKLLVDKQKQPEIPIQPIKETAPPKVAKKEIVPQKKEVIALKPPQKVNNHKKVLEDKTKELLADIKKHQDKPKKILPKVTKARFEKTLKEQAEKSLRQQLLDEEIKLQDQMERKAQGIVNKYAALIKQAIAGHWIVPAGIDKHLRCKLTIRLAPKGLVLDVQVIKSSGDLALDHSARAAVFNASPLPVPKEEKIFDQFRVFEMDMSPKDIISSSG